eukprot:940001-Pleurochrysis_carterae.AAC.1
MTQRFQQPTLRGSASDRPCTRRRASLLDHDATHLRLSRSTEAPGQRRPPLRTARSGRGGGGCWRGATVAAA